MVGEILMSRRKLALYPTDREAADCMKILEINGFYGISLRNSIHN